MRRLVGMGTHASIDFVFRSTTALASAVQRKQISATELLAAHIGQIEARNPPLNAIVTLDLERARERARQADQALARGEVWGPLHGVPFTLKDAHATAGVRTTTGFPPFANQIPVEDGTVAARLKAAGGILIGKTNVAEMLADYQTSNRLFGRTNNPWDVGRTSGGSSGGAAAAVASGMAAFDVGTDMSGSIRIPASFCGVFGLKPTEGRVSTAGVIPGLQGPRSVRLLSCVGPLARTVEDLALIFRILAGPDGKDTEVEPVPVVDVPALPLEKLTIAVAPTLPGLPVSAAARAAIDKLAGQLQGAGARVETPPVPALDFPGLLANAGALMGMMVGAFQPADGQPPTTLAAYLKALHQRDQAMIAWDRFFDAWDVLLCPAAMTNAFLHCKPGTPVPVDGKPVDYFMISGHTTVFNYSGHPAVALPAGLDAAGLPQGVQLVGRRWDEARLLAAAAAITPLTGGFAAPPAPKTSQMT
jgi:amidase